MERIYLRWVVPINLWPFVIVWPIGSIFVLYVTIKKEGLTFHGDLWYTSYVMIFFVGFDILSLLWISRIYRVSYDDSAVYQRQKLDFDPTITLVMPYKDIDCVVGDKGRGINIGKSFEYVRIYRKDWDGQEIFMLSPYYLNNTELKNLLHFIYQKRPDAFSQEVIDYMNNPRL